MEQQQQDVCVRCCEPLESSDARFNRTYWGMAHQKCTSDAIWPPRFRPALDPNEVLRQIAALCAHLAKITIGRGTGLPIPQILDRGLSPRAAVDRPSALESSDFEEKHGQRDLPVYSRRASSDSARAMEARATPARKRTQRPKPSPKATPSPKSKQARQDERSGDDIQAGKQHPVIPPTTTNHQPPTTTPTPNNN